MNVVYREFIIQSTIENEKSATPESKSIPVVTEEPLIENLNRLQIDGEEARSVDEALQLLRYESYLEFSFSQIILLVDRIFK